MIEFFGAIEGMFEEIEGVSYLSVKFLKLQPGMWPRLTFYASTDRIVYDAGDSKHEEEDDGFISNYLEHGTGIILFIYYYYVVAILGWSYLVLDIFHCKITNCRELRNINHACININGSSQSSQCLCRIHLATTCCY